MDCLSSVPYLEGMDLNDLISGGSDYINANKPASLDMDRIMEIVLEMKILKSSDPEQHASNWLNHIKSIIDFDALAWQAINVGFGVFGIKTGADLLAMRSDPVRNSSFIQAIQAFYDGFLLGATFVQRGGHRELPQNF